MSAIDQIKPDYGERGAGPPRTPPGLRQWFSKKTTGDKLDLVFQQAADNDCRVEQAVHVGGRDWIVCYSMPVQR